MITPDFAAAINAAAEDQATNLAPIPGRVMHVDGDYLAYYAAGGDDMPAGTARMVARDRILNMQRQSRSESVVLQLTDDASDKGLRYRIATVKTYQGNRSGKSKPKNWSHVREYLLNTQEFGRRVWIDREADDGIAFAAHCDGEPIVISSTDKDMRMLPGYHLDWKTGEVVEVPKGTYSIIGDNGLQYGLKWFCLQMLQGDAADNCPGLEFVVCNGKRKRCGEKTAEDLLADCSDFTTALWRVATHYRNCYADEWADRFMEQAALMWLRADHFASPVSVCNFLPADLYAEIRQAAGRLANRIGYALL